MSYISINTGKIPIYESSKRNKQSGSFMKPNNFPKFSNSSNDNNESLNFTKMLGNRSQSVLKQPTVNTSLTEFKQLNISKSTFGFNLQDYKNSTRNSIAKSAYFSVLKKLIVDA